MLKQLHHIGEVQDRTADPVQLIHDHLLYLSSPDIRKKLLQLRPGGIFTTVSTILVLPEGSALQFILAELNLTLNRDTVCPVHGLPGINCIDSVHKSPPFSSVYGFFI